MTTRLLLVISSSDPTSAPSVNLEPEPCYFNCHGRRYPNDFVCSSAEKVHRQRMLGCIHSLSYFRFLDIPITTGHSCYCEQSWSRTARKLWIMVVDLRSWSSNWIGVKSKAWRKDSRRNLKICFNLRDQEASPGSTLDESSNRARCHHKVFITYQNTSAVLRKKIHVDFSAFIYTETNNPRITLSN